MTGSPQTDVPLKSSTSFAPLCPGAVGGMSTMAQIDFRAVYRIGLAVAHQSDDLSALMNGAVASCRSPLPWAAFTAPNGKGLSYWEPQVGPRLGSVVQGKTAGSNLHRPTARLRNNMSRHPVENFQMLHGGMAGSARWPLTRNAPKSSNISGVNEINLQIPSRHRKIFTDKALLSRGLFTYFQIKIWLTRRQCG